MAVAPAPERPARASLLRGGLLIGVGLAAGQGLLLLASPALTRLYDPAAFGVLAVYAGVVSVLVVIATGCLDQAVPIAHDDRDADALVRAGMGSASVAAVLVGLVWWWWGDAIAARGGHPALARIGAWVALGILVGGVLRCALGWAMRREDHPAQAAARLWQGALDAGSKLLLGLTGIGAVGLVVGDAAGRGGGLLRLGWRWWRQRPVGGQRRGALATAWRYRRYPLVAGGSALVNASGLHLPALLFAAWWSPAVAGQFGLAILVLGAPVALVGQALGQVWFGRAALLAREDPAVLRRLFDRCALALLAAGALLLVAVALPAPWWFPLVFGAEWGPAGEFTRALGILYLAQLAVSPLSPTVYIIDGLRMQLAWDLARLATVVTIFVIGINGGYAAGTVVAAYAVAMAVAYAVLLVLYRARLARLGA